MSRPEGDFLVVISARIRRGTPAAFDFTYLGSSATVFDVPAGGAPQLRHQLDITPDSTAADQVNWGSAMTVSGDWLYVYGTRLPQPGLVRPCPVCRPRTGRGRARPRDVAVLGRRDLGARAGRGPRSILPARGGVSQTLSVDAVDGHFVIVSKRDGDLGNTVYAWSSRLARRSVDGPARDQGASSRTRPGQLKYAPLAHPGIELADGRLLISISRNTTDFGRPA